MTSSPGPEHQKDAVSEREDGTRQRPVRDHLAPPRSVDEPAGPRGDAESVSRPSEVDTAFWLWVAAVVLVVVAVVFTLPSEETLEQIIVEKLSGHEIAFDPAWASRMVGMARPIIQSVCLIAAALWLLVARQMRAGRNWARTMLALVGGIHIVVMLSRIVRGPGFGTTSTSLTLIALLTIVEILAIVRTYRPSACAYFTSR